MKMTTIQPIGATATNHLPLSTSKGRRKQSYHGRTFVDKLVLGVVVTIALVVIALSFQNTALLAQELSLNPYLTAGLVEVLFASLLFIRGRQRATQRNVPVFLTLGYFVSLGFVTAVNMWGLSQENPVIGPIVGAAITGAMWLMESVLVWLWVDSHKPHKKSMRERKREAEKEIKEKKLNQRIQWLYWEADKPDLDLIREAREAEEKRKKVVADGLPEFFKPVEVEQVERDSVPAAPVHSGTPVPVEWDSIPDDGLESGTPVPDTPAAQLYMYHRKKKKFPGRVVLSRICEMSERKARRVLDKMNDKKSA